jgi:hypothetical protein
MTIVSRRILTPLPGQAAAAAQWAKRMAEVMASHGAMVRVFRSVMGKDAGNLEILGRFANFTEGAKANAAIAADPKTQKLWQDHEASPVATIQGPYVYRMVFGEAAAQPVMMRRQYKVDRKNLKAALEMLPEAKAAIDKNTGMLAVIPSIAPDMDMLSISYYADSLEQMGQNLDTYGMSEKFQAVVNKASQYGTLTSSDALIVI